MNIIFLTLVRIADVEEKGIYSDLMRKFRNEGHQVYIVTPCERRMGLPTSIVENKGVNILNVRTLNIQKTNVIEKGIGTLLVERQYIKAIKKYLSDVQFDLITYSTPPITFTNVVKYLKKRNPQPISYLQLKDIFPQNAADLGMFGEKSLFYWYFRRKEKSLYRVSDYIGCMSPANVKFVLDHNPELGVSRIEVAPNSIEIEKQQEAAINTVTDIELQEKNERFYIRKKYDLPTDKPIFIYGGNLGKPQGINYLVKCLEAVKNRLDCYFVVVGSGTEKNKLDNWYEQQDHDDNFAVKVMSFLPKEDYDMLVKYCDVGLIFLDYRFTIPNYPSRLLSYLENKMPVICATDKNTDIGRIAEENGYGYWCESVNPEDFVISVDKILKSDRKTMGVKGYNFLCQNYLVEHTYHAIMKHFTAIDRLDGIG